MMVAVKRERVGDGWILPEVWLCELFVKEELIGWFCKVDARMGV